jgi:hypothetical protein
VLKADQRNLGQAQSPCRMDATVAGEQFINSGPLGPER